MKATNKNRSVGNHIIIAHKEGKTSYWNWYEDGMIADRTNATGYDSKKNANYVIEQLEKEHPEYTFKTELDKG